MLLTYRAAGTNPLINILAYLQKGLLRSPVREIIERLDRSFMALADPVRRSIIARLSLGDATPNELAEPFQITKQAISRHLQVLEHAGPITRSRDAQRRPCHLEAAALEAMTNG